MTMLRVLSRTLHQSFYTWTFMIWPLPTAFGNDDDSQRHRVGDVMFATRTTG